MSKGIVLALCYVVWLAPIVSAGDEQEDSSASTRHYELGFNMLPPPPPGYYYSWQYPRIPAPHKHTPPPDNSNEFVRSLVKAYAYKIFLDWLLARRRATTVSTAMPTTAESTAVVVTTAEVTTIPMVTLPGPFNTWHEYNGCRYRAFTTPQFDDVAITQCSDFGSGTTLAQRNVRAASDREALFRGVLGLTVKPLWIGLKDEDGTAVVKPAKWLNGDDYVTEADVTVQYTSGPLSTIAQAVGFNYKNIIHAIELNRASNAYVCEFCPP